MPKRKTTKTEDGLSPVDQISAYLETNKADHYNFEEERSYVVSSGSLLLDIEMGGGIGPGVIRASGITEGGKTSCDLAFAKNFQKMDNSMAVYIKSEGRLSTDMIERAGVSTDENKWFVYKSNVYESVINLMRLMVTSFLALSSTSALATSALALAASASPSCNYAKPPNSTLRCSAPSRP